MSGLYTFPLPLPGSPLLGAGRSGGLSTDGHVSAAATSAPPPAVPGVRHGQSGLIIKLTHNRLSGPSGNGTASICRDRDSVLYCALTGP